MMVWNLACDAGDLFAGFAPISGTFWAPVPDRCEAPTSNLFHTHGLHDRIVPLRGRRIGDARQGDLRVALQMYAAQGGFEPSGNSTELGMICARQKNADGKVLELCLHEGGHVIRTDALTRIWRELESIGAI